MAKTTRRDFIKTGAGAMGAGLMLPVFDRTALGATVVRQLRDELAGENRTLVVIELAGGNDGLNTIVPLQQYDTYASFRTRVAIPKDQVLPLFGSTTMGLNPHLSAIKPLADSGKLAVVQAVHYPRPNLSHESSRLIYQRGNPDPVIKAVTASGWLGRHAALFGNPANSVDTIGIGGAINPSLKASGASVSGVIGNNQGDLTGYGFPTDPWHAGDRNNRVATARFADAAPAGNAYIDFIEQAQANAFASVDQVAAAAGAYTGTANYPRSAFGGGFKLIAKLITSTAPTLGTRVFYISLGGFDTHGGQTISHRQLMLLLGAALRAFFEDLTVHNLADKTLVMIWSEFGRRVADNASAGTDHGTANNILLLGGRVKGGVYGRDPRLTDLEAGNLKWEIDFRAVYQTIIESWFGNSTTDAARVLDGNFGNLGFMA